MKNKDAFFSALASYIRNGIVVPIYASEGLAVLRVADAFYVASDYTMGKKGYISLLVNSKMIRAMMVDEGFLQQMLTSYDQRTLASMLFELDADTFRQFRKGKKGSPVSDLTHRFVDDQMEKWITDSYGKPEYAIPEKKGLFGFLKK